MGDGLKSTSGGAMKAAQGLRISFKVFTRAYSNVYDSELNLAAIVLTVRVLLEWFLTFRQSIGISAWVQAARNYVRHRLSG